MKILFANNICGYFGGVEQVIVDVARGFKERGHTCYLAYGVTKRNVDLFSIPFEKCLPCTDFGVAPPPADGLGFEDLVKQVQPDVIFVHKVTRLPDGFERLGVRTVRMVHDHDLYCPTGFKYFRRTGRICHCAAGWRCWPDLAFLRRNDQSPLGISFVSIPGRIREMRRNHQMDAVLAVSSFIRNGLLSNGFPDERVHIVNPILPAPLAEAQEVPETPRILFVGQLIRGKGLDLLLHALKRLTCDFSLTVLGTGNSAEKLKTLSNELGLAEKVTFIEWVNHDEMSGYYAAAKVVAAPSRWPEPFTLVGQESMRHGRPVVAFSVGGNPDWLEDGITGLLVPEQDIEGYAQALQQLLTDTPLARKLGANAHRRVQERFSFDRFLDALEHHLTPVSNGK